MTRNNDILFMAEYIKNVLYFATVRPGRILKNTADIHYFCIDNELIYENYYSDFGPLNLGCIYKYCRILNEKIEQCQNNQIIVHYTSSDPKKRTNAAFLLGCFGVLYLSLPPKEALKPLIVHGYSYRPFQDATPGDSSYTISILDCLKAINKAREIGFFNFQDFNYREYDRLDKIQGGDLNWIIPGKFLAFIGPVEHRGPLYHRPEEYINYFKENNVKIVIRLNKRLYDGNVFNNVGIIHYDLFFPDGSCPPRNILFKFLQISECSEGAIAVHCKAGLGRTGSLIGCYLIKHYRMTSHEAIGWMRICRPGSVIGQQQEWLEQLEPWLIKQGNLYRRRKFGDENKLPVHEYGLYSISEKALKQKPVLLSKSPSPPPPIQRHNRIDISLQPRPQASKTRDGENNENEETFLTSCDLTVKPSVPMFRMKGCIINSSTVFENDGLDCPSENLNLPKWKRILFCHLCANVWNEMIWKLAVRCVKYTPKFCNSTNVCCNLIDKDCYKKVSSGYAPIPTFCTTQGPIVKTVNEARDFLMRAYKENRERQLSSTLRVTSKMPFQRPNAHYESTYGITTCNSPSSFRTVAREFSQPHYRRRLGRSPSPPQARLVAEQSRATNTPPPKERMLKRDSSKSTIRDALSKLKLAVPRYGSIGAGSVGAASLGARRDAPKPKQAPSVRSDERPTATQGDLLNSIKFQRRFRETLNNEKINSMFRDNQDSKPGDKTVGGTSRSLFNRPSSPKGRHSMQNSFFY
ncbi:unnamed protein product [Parnassius mnemosyne]|uniref:protein-tyrosine-phosphatase n=1 Tax=Parnassius mnemosyne TaxID=213953 RepID=A0AAV1L8R6_9NEOP